MSIELLYVTTAGEPSKLHVDKRQSKAGMPNFPLVVGQIFVCKFTSGHNRCSNQGDVLMQVTLKILR